MGFVVLWVCWKFLACYGVSKIQYQNTIGIHKSKQSDEQVTGPCLLSLSELAWPSSLEVPSLSLLRKKSLGTDGWQ